LRVFSRTWLRENEIAVMIRLLICGGTS
jgi:hypothetical protein